MDAVPASEMTAQPSNGAKRHSLKTETARIELAQIRVDSVFRRISEALFATRPYNQLAETRNIDISRNIAD